MSISVRPLSPAVGVEISGVDTSKELSAAVWRLIDDAWREHHLLLFRNQDLTPEQQVLFSKHFGPVSHQGDNMQQGREYMHISNTVQGGAVPTGELLFHSDHMFFEKVMKAISLNAVELPALGGDTIFANAEKAYERLPATLKQPVANLRALHAFGYADNSGSRRFTLAGQDASAVQAVHPIAWPHPDTGRPVLLIAELMTQEILDLGRDESERLIAELLGYVKDSGVTYQHRWRLKDFIIWDNRSLQHARSDFDPSEKRTLRRVPIAEPQRSAVAKT